MSKFLVAAPGYIILCLHSISIKSGRPCLHIPTTPSRATVMSTNNNCCVAYVLRNMYETELSLLADPDYMQNHGPEYQPKLYIDQSMRMIVISWLVEVACEFELHQETLFLPAALLDRFMSVAKVHFIILAIGRPSIVISLPRNPMFSGVLSEISDEGHLETA